MGWQQSFDKVHDLLILRVGGEGGPVITWPDRGFGGQYTWCWADPTGETRDISAWVGEADRISLWAQIFENGATGDHQCDMDTRYNGESKQRWEFDGQEDHDDIER